jgi:transposase
VRLSLSDEQWKVVARRMLEVRGAKGKNNRLFFEAVLWILRTGTPWRDLPRLFGKWETNYRRFRRWCLSGLWEHLRADLPVEHTAIVMIDSTIVRAHQHSAGGRGGKEQNAIGKSRGGLTTKIHVIINELGKMIACEISGGQEHDVTYAQELLQHAPLQATVIGDKGYDSNAFVTAIEQRGGIAVIPPRRTRVVQRYYDRLLYRSRNLIERYFARLKQFRRMATRYEKTLKSFAGFLAVADFHLLWRLQKFLAMNCAIV